MNLMHLTNLIEALWMAHKDSDGSNPVVVAMDNDGKTLPLTKCVYVKEDNAIALVDDTAYEKYFKEAVDKEDADKKSEEQTNADDDKQVQA